MIKALLMDLDGVVYRGATPVDGAVEFIRRWKKRGLRFAYITNRSARTPDAIAAHLAAIGVPCAPEEIHTSALATARYLGGGSAFVIGGEGLYEAIRQEKIRITERNPDAVVIGGDPSITHEKLTLAVRFILAGAAFVATNADRLVNTESGVAPANGAIVQAIAYATRVTPKIIGKPESTLLHYAMQDLGVGPEDVLFVGDNIETDIEAGRRARIKTVHLLTGVFAADWTEPNYEGLDRLMCSLHRKERQP